MPLLRTSANRLKRRAANRVAHTGVIVPFTEMVVAMGVEPATPSAESIEQAAEFVPVETLSASEFDDLLIKHGLPIGK